MQKVSKFKMFSGTAISSALVCVDIKPWRTHSVNSTQRPLSNFLGQRNPSWDCKSTWATSTLQNLTIILLDWHHLGSNGELWGEVGFDRAGHQWHLTIKRLEQNSGEAIASKNYLSILQVESQCKAFLENHPTGHLDRYCLLFMLCLMLLLSVLMVVFIRKETG